MLRKHAPLLIFLTLVATGAAAYVYFSVKASVTVFESSISISPKSFSVNVAKGGHYVRELTIVNTGGEAEVYFDEIVEGPQSDAIDVSYHRSDGSSITSTNKLLIPAGSEDNPAKVKINVHVSVDEDAAEGEYTIYIIARS